MPASSPIQVLIVDDEQAFVDVLAKRFEQRDITVTVAFDGREEPMPYVNIKITRESVTAEKKAALIKAVTDLLADLLGKNPQTTVVVIDEVDTDNWGIGGETVSVRRRRGQ